MAGNFPNTVETGKCDKKLNKILKQFNCIYKFCHV